MKNIAITIPSVAENIRVVESFIDNAKEKFSLNDDIYGNIMVAVTEAVNNSIHHGNKNDAKKNVGLRLILEDRAVKFRIEDDGPGFDHSTLPDPTAPENKTKTYGRGVFLMQNLADEVNFEKGGKVVELVFHINP